MGNKFTTTLPATMKAAQYTETGTDFSNIKLVEVPLAAPSAGQIVVKNEFAAINPVDGKVYGGHLKAAGWALPLPFTPGYDFAGKVAAVGSDVKGLKVGDDVWAVNWGAGKHDEDGKEGATVGGAFAEYITLPAHKVSKRPAALPADQAAAVALVGTTAHESLFKHGQCVAGQKVLILGGAGAVGLLAVQLAKKRGLWVATTASPRTRDFVSTLGADLIVDYTKEDWSQVPELKGIDMVFDTMGSEGDFAKAKTILKEDGRFVTIASFEAGFDPTAHKPLSFASFICLSNDTATQDELAKLIVDGSLKVPIDSRFDFTNEGIEGIFKKQAEGKSIGKNVIKF